MTDRPAREPQEGAGYTQATPLKPLASDVDLTPTAVFPRTRATQDARRAEDLTETQTIPVTSRHDEQSRPSVRAALRAHLENLRPERSGGRSDATSTLRASLPGRVATSAPGRATDAAPGSTRAADTAAEEAAGTTSSARRRKSGPSVSTRVMAALAAIAAVGLVLATAVFWWSEDRVRDQQVDADLAQEVATLRTLAGARDPATGEQFTSTDALLSTFVTRNVPSEHEGFAVLIDDVVPFLPPFADRLALEEMPGVLEIARAVEPGDAAARHEIDHEGDEIRFLTVPVSVEGDEAHGVLVVGANVSAVHEVSSRARLAQAFILAGTVILIGLAAAVVVTRLLRPLGTLARTAERISEEDLSQRIPETGSDDIAELTRTVNGMLDRLEAAFQGQRDLLDDVGHELRTPLTVIRGQLEVMDVEDPADVRETRDLVMDESDRMARLVEELVLLAKSMRPDFVTLRPLAMDDVVHALLERVAVLGERRWRLDNLSDAWIDGDAQRLLQAGLQLAANAVRHTGEDDEIGIGAAVDGDLVRLWVRDTGDGVPAAEQQGIFERAVRGSATLAHGGTVYPPESATGETATLATSDTTSSGLGLSIVSAIARAHGGRATLASTAGAGSTFAVEVPLRHDDDSTTENEENR